MTPEARFREYIKSKGLKQNEVASMLSQSESYFGRVLRGKHNFTNDMITQIADKFPELDMNWLFRGAYLTQTKHSAATEEGTVLAVKLLDELSDQIAAMRAGVAQS